MKWKRNQNITPTFPSHLKKLHSILRSWLEKLNCGFFHSFYSWKNNTKQTPQNNFSSQNFSVENNYLFIWNMHGYWTWHTKRSVPDCRRLGICFVVNWKHECIWQITLFFVRRRKLIESVRKKKCLDELSIKIILQRERQNLCTTNTKYVRTWSCSKWIGNGQ